MRIKPCRRFSFSVCKPESEQVLETSCRQSTAANPFWDGDWSLALQACLTHMYSWHAYLNILSKGLARNHVESCTLVVIFFVRSRLLLFSLVGQHTQHKMRAGQRVELGLLGRCETTSRIFVPRTPTASQRSQARTILSVSWSKSLNFSMYV